MTTGLSLAEHAYQRLAELGWTFLGEVGTHRYWLNGNGSWRTQAQAFAYLDQYEAAEAAARRNDAAFGPIGGYEGDAS